MPRMWKPRVVKSAKSDLVGEPAGDCARALLIEDTLDKTSRQLRFANTDHFLSALEAARVLRRCRELNPDLVRQAEADVYGRMYMAKRF